MAQPSLPGIVWARPRIEERLTAEQCNEIAARIVNWFHTTPTLNGGRSFGCDWPTMRALFPYKCRVFDRLKAQYCRLVPTRPVLLGHMERPK